MSKQQTHHEPACLALPRFERVKYFYGQLLGVREFQSEQSYFLEKHRLHNRYLHGYGVVCGLGVERCKETDPCPPKQEGPPKELCVEVECGLALDCCGNEVVVASDVQLDVLARLGDEQRRKFFAGERLYITVCFVESALEPVRPLRADSCGALVPDCVPSRVRDDFCIRVSFDRTHDCSCSPCERPCNDPCLALAELRWCDGQLVIDESIRRTVAPFVTTRIDGISWVHGGRYSPEDADEMLHEGLVFHFSDDVHRSTLRRGVIDIWIVQGGDGRRGDIYNAGAHIVHEGSEELVRSVTVKVGHRHRGDRIDPGDRVLITLRSPFVLDRCCRAIDGDHIGGLVPVIPAFQGRWPTTNQPVVAPCRPREMRPHTPWMSGNGNPAGNFESWFFVHDEDDQAGGW